MARPREFDQDEVVDKAMMLFWQQGYETTSIRDLKQAMGMSTSSMYEVFGDKRGVYLAALGRFCQIEQARIATMARDVSHPQELIQALFASVEEMGVGSEGGQTSMAYNAMIEFGTRDPEVTEALMAHYVALVGIVAAVIEGAQQRGTIRDSVDAQSLAHTILAALQGVATVKSAQPTFSHGRDIVTVLVNLLQ